MSPTTELMSDFVTRNCDILKMTLADFTAEEMLARPVPGRTMRPGRSATCSGRPRTNGAVVPGIIPESVVKLGERYTGKTANVDDPGFYPEKTDCSRRSGRRTGRSPSGSRRSRRRPDASDAGPDGGVCADGGAPGADDGEPRHDARRADAGDPPAAGEAAAVLATSAWPPDACARARSNVRVSLRSNIGYRTSAARELQKKLRENPGIGQGYYGPFLRMHGTLWSAQGISCI